MKRVLAWLLAAACTLAAGEAAARNDSSYPYRGFALDLVQGPSFPLGDKDYKRFADPSYKLQLRFAYEFPLGTVLLVAPELMLDVSPVNTNDDTFQNNRIDAKFTRFRTLVGGRVGVRLGIVQVYARIALGVDYLSGSFSSALGTSDQSSTAFTFEPGVGFNVQVIEHLLMGLSLGFPIASHELKDSRNITVLNSSFTAGDCDLLFLIGGRF
jgi:hypothetical protein